MTDWSFSFTFAGIGILIVFGALTIISVAIGLIRKLNDRWQDKEDADKAAATTKEPTIDSLTIVLITAAVATMLQGRFYIRRVRRLLPADAPRGPWSVEGRAILHGSHVFKRGR